MNFPGAMDGNRYYDKHFQTMAVKVFPGEFHATNQRLMLVTLLGSCVAVCLSDRTAGVCGMNHFLLPEGSLDLGAGASAARFGVNAMELLITDMQKLGAMRHRLEAKIFGAANVLDGMTVVNVGERNSQFIRSYLANEQIPVLAEDLLGECARKVYFFTETGRVLIKKLKRSGVAVKAEQPYRGRILEQGEGAKTGDIDLFL
ncbi:chemoreceptor glutamine deamidase CheD [Chromobacterium subtsugae]|uniref:Probable chemoreceptor glutamine deamidase CheD n=1 Tax=Chromobacterium subtsugae TaxID=251747 RepID=A0ABS7FA44_9NEIS|nr:MULTISPECIES: chemoreceptor glutamine deamidase CheD [Chromobacterium]KUM04489.1 chemotaxis protein CheD [Chromobacterium subtsugae]KZE87058.1 chemotaxis protein CheD [Chromobacterium sp. F49]MBW7566005.1 chemoreceptor glutamine deamidase CheD [Chromobacterium subtsugae]MBW8286955.1 chemoreceptor glutamine deamidase CheD [Chromobacterium subtsugae]WSE93033.1 chemoreceptor glutamine deamidase CheD [Chromobacterium subtsugae]